MTQNAPIIIILRFLRFCAYPRPKRKFVFINQRLWGNWPLFDDFWSHFGSWTTYTDSSHLDLLMTNHLDTDEHKKVGFASGMIWFSVLCIILWDWSLNKNDEFWKKVNFCYVSSPWYEYKYKRYCKLNLNYKSSIYLLTFWPITVQNIPNTQ